MEIKFNGHDIGYVKAGDRGQNGAAINSHIRLKAQQIRPSRTLFNLIFLHY